VSATRVLLVDDHVLVRAGLRALIDMIEGIDVIGEAGDGRKLCAWSKFCTRTSCCWTLRCPESMVSPPSAKSQSVFLTFG
jgi:hypothetical protein